MLAIVEFELIFSLNFKLKPLINDLQKYYKSNIVVSNVVAWRTNHADELEAKKNMLYAKITKA